MLLLENMEWKSTGIWEDPWLPYQGWYKILTWKPFESNVF